MLSIVHTVTPVGEILMAFLVRLSEGGDREGTVPRAPRVLKLLQYVFLFAQLLATHSLFSLLTAAAKRSGLGCVDRRIKEESNAFLNETGLQGSILR